MVLQDEEEMDDEAMFRLDGAISDAFKSMKKSSKKEEKQKAIQIRSFKMRWHESVIFYENLEWYRLKKNNKTKSGSLCNK